MAASLQVRVLHESEIVRVEDVRCRPHSGSCGPEEHAGGDQLVFPRRGCFVRHVGRRALVADAASVQFFGRDQPYRVSHPVAGGDDCTSLAFAPAVLAEAFGGGPQAVPRAARAPAGAEACLLLQRLRGSLHAGAWIGADETAMRLLEVLAASAGPVPARRVGERTSTTRAHRDLVENTRVFLAAHLGERLTLAGVARAVHSSPFHLARVFRRLAGLSLHGHLTRLRLRAALERLSGGEHDLLALALDLGFASHSHLTHAFRREYREPPSALRRALAFPPPPKRARS